jgi:hypothetical protein
MVYERISIDTKRHVLTKRESGMSRKTWPDIRKTDDSSSITFIRTSIEPALLQSCRLVRQEATPFMRSKLAELRREPLHVLVDYAALHALLAFRSPLLWCFGMLPMSLTYTERSNQLTREFVKRCQMYMRHKRLPKAFGAANVIITITESRRDLPQSVVRAAFEQIRDRAFDLEAVFGVVYKHELGAPVRPSGSWGTVDLSGPMFEEHLRKLTDLG